MNETSEQLKQKPPIGERLLKALQEANEWARGERDDLRVTTVTLPDPEPEPTAPIQPSRNTKRPKS